MSDAVVVPLLSDVVGDAPESLDAPPPVLVSEELVTCGDAAFSDDVGVASTALEEAEDTVFPIQRVRVAKCNAESAEPVSVILGGKT